MKAPPYCGRSRRSASHEQSLCSLRVNGESPESTMQLSVTPHARLRFEIFVQQQKARLGRFAIRYVVLEGVAALSWAGKGEKTPTMRSGQIHNLTADQIRHGRFTWIINEATGEMSEFSLWRASEHPRNLPLGIWTRLLAYDDGLVPEGWEIEAPPSVAETVTEVEIGSGLGAALKLIKARRKQRQPKKAEASGVGAPPALIRHLRRTIDRQRQEIDALRIELEHLRRR